MSMNVRLGTDTCHCTSIRQTRTVETYTIVESDDPMQAYFEWLRKRMDEWHEQDMADPEGDGDEFRRTYWDHQYKVETGLIRAYAESHPNAKWSAG